jgi:PAS domain S-box-containing protein
MSLKQSSTADEAGEASHDADVAARVDAQLKQCLDRAAEGLHWVGPDGTILWANQTELDLLGYGADEYIGRHIGEFHVDAPVIQDILARLKRGETLRHYDARLRHKDGSVRYVQINSRVLWRGSEFVRTQCFTRDVTDQRVAHELARRLAEIVENSEDAIYSQDLDGNITSWNPAAERLHGYLAHEAVGQSIRLIVPPEAQHEEDDIVRRVRGGERVPPFDTKRQRKDASLVDVSLTVSPVRDRDGTIVGASKMARDISRRRWLEARDRFLVDLDDAVRPLTDASEIAHAAAKALGRHLRVPRCAYAIVEEDQDTFTLTGNFNDGVPRLVGRYTFGQFGDDCLRSMRAGVPYVVADSDVDARIDDADRAAYRKAAIRGIVCVPVLKHGRLVAALTVHTAAPRAWEPEEVELVQRVASRCWESVERAELRDRERQAREDAELQKRLLHSLFMQAPTLIAVLRGPDHVIELANPPMCQAWAREHADLIGRPLFAVMPELGDQGFKDLLDEVYRTGVAYEGKETPARFLRRDGRAEVLYFDFLYSSFRNIAGDIEGIFVVASDVTEQVLSRNQLDDLRKGAEAANRAKDEFLAMLGHELRNPLSPILTALELMKLRASEDSRRERTVIERQVAHLTRLVDDLLDVSRIARGKVELKKEITEIAEVVAKAIEMTSPLLEQRTHSLTVNVARQGLAVEGDATRLSQVVSNLLTNAAKYTPPGGHIHVSASATHEDVILRVRDNGVGIAAEVLARVFDLFVQERQAIDRSQGGLGLGLTIVRNLVEGHGGTVSAHSEGAGRGSEFTVRLPRVNSAAVPGPVLHAVPTDAAAAASGMRILVVDDNVDSACTLSEILRVKGHATRVAHDGPDALNAAAEFHPDLAFLDIGLPVMDGYELAARLRALPGLSGIRLIALTGYGQESDREQTRAVGFEHHLVKPVDLSIVESITATLHD